MVKYPNASEGPYISAEEQGTLHPEINLLIINNLYKERKQNNEKDFKEACYLYCKKVLIKESCKDCYNGYVEKDWNKETAMEDPIVFEAEPEDKRIKELIGMVLTTTKYTL